MTHELVRSSDPRWKCHHNHTTYSGIGETTYVGSLGHIHWLPDWPFYRVKRSRYNVEMSSRMSEWSDIYPPLPGRALNAIVAHGFTIADARAASDEVLLSIRNLGKGSLASIRLATGGQPIVDLDAEDLLLLEPRAMYDRCLLGIARRFTSTFAVYDEECVLDAIAADADDDDEDPTTTAREHYEFNIVGGWVGDGTPAFLSQIRSSDD